MGELFSVILSFSIIPVLNKRKVSIGIAICASAVLMAVLGGIGLSSFYNVIINTFFNFTKVQHFIVVIEIGILGVLLKQYNIIDGVIGHLNQVVRSRRVMIMFIPALIGLLSVPGGAIMSAPLVDKLGEESNVPKSHRAIINLVYRHVSMHIMPYATGFLLVAALVPRVSIYKLMGLNSIFIVLYCIIGYFLYIRQVENSEVSESRHMWSSIISLLKYTSPVYIAVLLNLIFHVPFYIGMLANLLAVYFIHPTKKFIADAVRGFNINVVYALIGVYLIQGVIGEMESLTSSLTRIFSSPNTIILGIIITSFFLGITTGFQPAALGVVLPILAALPISESRLLLYCYFTFEWSFAGYFFSPLHLCQLFTCECIKVSAFELYKEYWKFFLSLCVILVLNFFILGIWLK